MKLDPDALNAAEAAYKAAWIGNRPGGRDGDNALAHAITAYLAALPQSQDIRALVEELRAYKHYLPAMMLSEDYEHPDICDRAADALSCLAGEGPTGVLLNVGWHDTSDGERFIATVAFDEAPPDLTAYVVWDRVPVRVVPAPSVEEKLP